MYHQVIRCYVCNAARNRRQLSRINDDQVREIAIARRDSLLHPPLECNVGSRLCLNCRESILHEIATLEANPHALRLNVVSRPRSGCCLVCHNVGNNMSNISAKCRVNIFVKCNIYVPENIKACNHHLNDEGLFPTMLLEGLRSFNRPYEIKGPQILLFLQNLRNLANNKNNFENYQDISDEDFKIISSMTKPQFENLFTYCDRVLGTNSYRYIQKKDLLMFLCKLRQGLSDNFLKIIFHYSSRQVVSDVVATVRKSLLVTFVHQYVGFQSISRNDFIERHVTEFANELYNPEPNTPRAIVTVDATYSFAHQSKNFRVLRQSFSFHKKRHLFKPTMIVAPDGYILSILGPYFSDSKNNDSSILLKEFEKDTQRIREWFHEGDIILVDRGYRDAVPWLEEMGITCWMPALLENGQRQLTTEDSNMTRKITKNRWVVESRNGHFRSIFKFFSDKIIEPHMNNLYDFYCIAAALINKYHPPLIMQNASVELAREMKERSFLPNVVQARVEVDGLRLRRGHWVDIDENVLPDFPILELDYLHDLTVGVFQLKLAPSYVQDTLHENDGLQIDERLNEPGFIRMKVKSRFRRTTTHQVFIAYLTQQEVIDEVADPITGYYCTCQSGARTLGCCCHVACVLWYLGFARHQPNVKYPSTRLLDAINNTV